MSSLAFIILSKYLPLFAPRQPVVANIHLGLQLARGSTLTSSMATMEPGPHQRTYRTTRANGHLEGGSSARRAHHPNKRWVADAVTGRGSATTSHAGSETERWERGGHRGGGRGRARGSRGKFGNASVTFRQNGALDGGATGSEGEHSEIEEGNEVDEVDSTEPETPEEREKFWQEVRRKHGFLWLRSPCSPCLVGQGA